ncbi:MAG: hypothetical protein BWY76_02127 [bacterium ADurb.Bin429]|nr:MAG: hypothetical protein BWY76_02127 [bacterium ADurb.Bin429]
MSMIATILRKRFKDNIRQITRRTRGISPQRMREEVKTAAMGWVRDFHISAMTKSLHHTVRISR